MQRHGDEARQVGGGLADGDAGSQARDSLIAHVAQNGLVAIELKRKQKRGVPIEEGEIRWQDTDDFARDSVHCHGAAQYRVVASESRLPPCI